MASDAPAVEPLAPGVLIEEELEARGWSAGTLAGVLGEDEALIDDLIAGRRPLTPAVAVSLAAALGTSAELWMNLESAHRLSLAGPPDPHIRARAERQMASSAG